MWMLFNLALAFRARRRWPELNEVLAAACKLPQDHSFQQLRLLLAYELAAKGNTQEAASHFRELKTQGWSKYMLVQFQCVRSMLAVQTASPEERKKVFKTERATLRKFLAQLKLSTQRTDCRRCLARMATDAGNKWFLFLARIGIA